MAAVKEEDCRRCLSLADLKELVMRKCIPGVFPTFTQRFEGKIMWMYLDVKGLVTVGLGNLIDPMRLALGLNMVFANDANRVATVDEIAFEWRTMKLNQFLAKSGAQAAKRLSKLRLTEPALIHLVENQLNANEAILQKTFANWDSWPADAQLGVMSMAWAMGPGFLPHFPRFTMACSIEDWATAGANCNINTKNNAGLIPRNHADQALFKSAQQVVDQRLDFNTLYGWQIDTPVKVPSNVAALRAFKEHCLSRGIELEKAA
jgi:GH24 family phage-related lysozyme (muramidase)